MTTAQIAERLTELCRQGQYDEAQNELYSPDAESVEPPHAKGFHSVKGLDAIRQKGEQFRNMVEEIHGGQVDGPLVAGDRFSIAIKLDATMKGMGRTHMDEIAVYDVKDGKIVKEEFFY